MIANCIRRSCSPLLLLAAALPAQSGGPTLALAHGFSVDPATPLPALTAASVIQNDTELDSTFPTAYVPPPGVADFTLLPIPTAVDVDALSIGLDWVVADNQGTATVPPGQWAAITYTTSRATLGAAGSLIASETAAADGAAGDVFAWVLPGSALPPAIVGIPLRAQDSTEISVWSPAAAGNLDAHDVYVGLIYRENPQLAAMLPPPTVFFSVSDATKGAIPAAWAPIALRSGATVFSTTWVPATGTWTPPTVAYAPAAFGLAATEDIDGIAVDLVRGLVLFSTDIGLSPFRDPLLFSVLGSGLNTTYVLPQGAGPVSTALGLGSAPDDIDGVCALDPGTAANPHVARLDRLLGRWRNPALPTAPTLLQASLSRRFDVITQQEILVAFMTGWPPPGVAQPGIAACAVTLGQPQLGPYVTLDLALRPNALSPYFLFDGHPERCEWPIPPGWSGSNAPLTFLWVAASSVGFALSHPITLPL